MNQYEMYFSRWSQNQKKYILIFPESTQIQDFEIFIDPKKKGEKNNGL